MQYLTINMFSRAIVRTPGKSIVKGLCSAELGIPDYELALLQHSEYVKALQNCGLKVEVLNADEQYPDSTFIEDVALLTREFAIITNPGAPTRKGETAKIKEVLEKYFTNIEEIQEPGTVEAGDIMMAGTHFYIGLSGRTNKNGALQITGFLEKYGMTGSMVSLREMLHLKTGLSYLENNNLVACGEFLKKKEFQKFNILKVDNDESYAANCIWINGIVLVPEGYPKARKTIKSAGYQVTDLDVSEFEKLDGGLSCLSLRF